MELACICYFRGDYEFLSNFSVVGIPFKSLDGESHVAPSAEHAYQASKAISLAEQLLILSQPSPRLAKKVARRIELRQDWEEVKVAVMLDILRKKFNLHKELRKKLLATGDAFLLEGNAWGDQFWGASMTEDYNKQGEVVFVGSNMLGKLLMQVREELA